MPTAVQPGEPIAGSQQTREAWWPVEFAAENKCIIQAQIGRNDDCFDGYPELSIEDWHKKHGLWIA